MTQTPQGISLVADEAHAVLSILNRWGEGHDRVPPDWQELFESEGYRRLKEREASMRTPIDDAEFQTFVEMPELMASAGALKQSLQMFAGLGLEAIVESARNYLPPHAVVRGTIYPVIKPKPNSFVYELDTNPALFLSLKPDMRQVTLANTLIHELHHWGLASCSPSEDVKQRLANCPQSHQFACKILGAFGEGLAMLAAAGSPEKHPHETSPAEDRVRWDLDMGNVDEDLRTLEAFIQTVLDGEFEDEQALFEAAMPFFGIQGPWYTVGYEMARAIENSLGRDALIDCMSNMRTLLCCYNEAAAEGRARWSSGLIDRLFQCAGS